MSTYRTLLLLIAIIMIACRERPDRTDDDTASDGGGRDAITIDLPFASGYASQCVQGVGDSYSHSGTSTFYDLDFDTPNDEDDFVYAPIGGTAYVNETTDNFGIHINIDLGDGTYVLVAHLSEALIERGEEVSAGQIIGFEGTTGASTGDHVHIGRHEGKAWEDAVRGVSINGLSINVYNNASGSQQTMAVGEFVCDLYSGHTYTSRLDTPLWHPNGTLVKTPGDARVYLLEDGEARHIDDEDVFWSYNYSFDDLAIIDDDEMDCYDNGRDIDDETAIRVIYDNGQVWLLVGNESDSDRYAKRVRSTAWQATLKSWGIVASSYSDLDEDTDLLDDYPSESGYATFRDGAIVTEESSSDVYFVSNSIAMPILDWDTYLLMDLLARDLLQVENGAVETVQGKVGDCDIDSFCLSSSDIATCGGPSDDSYTADGGSQDDEEIEDPDDGSDDSEEEEPDDEEEVEEPEEEEEPDDEELPDDLREGLSWIRVDDATLGLHISEVFTGAVSGHDVVVTGVGVNASWSYDTDDLVDYDEDTDMGWYTFNDGWYRINMRTSDEWALFWADCLSAGNASELCHQNQDLSHALCFEVFDDEISPLSSQDCQSME